jgi:hypothetical protein
VLCRAGVIWRARSDAAVFWFLTAVMALGALRNFASQSRWESFILGALAAAPHEPSFEMKGKDAA